MQIGLVGKPSCGKSTFFKAATLAEVEIANYPFTTLKSKEGAAFVKINCVDEEMGVKCVPREGFCLKGKRFVPMKLMDVPGLIEGSYKGMGKGNEFLSDISSADALIHVIDASGGTNEKGEPCEEGSYDPANDVRFLEEELDQWYLKILKRGWEKFARTMQQEKLNVVKTIAKQLSGLKVTEECVLKSVKKLELFDKKPQEWSEDDLLNFAKEMRKRTKPMIIAANKSDKEISKKNIEKLKEEFKDCIIIPCSSDSEVALREAAKKEMIDYVPGESDFVLKSGLNEKQKNALEFIKKNVLDVYGTTGVQDVLNKIVFDVLDYICVYPVENSSLKDKSGNILPDCYIMRNGSTALDLAFRIHSDIGNNFVKAIDVKKKIPIGKNHALENGGVVEIMAKK